MAPPPPVETPAEVAELVWFYLDGVLYQRAQTRDFQNAVGGLARDAEPGVVGEPVRPSAVNRFARDARVLGQLRIPSVNLEVMIRQGLDDKTLRGAAGHLESSALPGQRGNLVLLAHRDTFFRPLRDLKRGDSVEIRTTSVSFRYEIDSIRVVEPEHVPDQIKAARGSDGITLITCFPFDYVGPSPRRFVAQGRLAGH